MGLEDLLLNELAAMGAVACRPHKAGVSFEGQIDLAMRACLWSRLASRVLMPLARFACEDAEGLYAGCASIAWETHLTDDTRFAVRVSVGPHTPERLQHSHFAALKVKDAVVDVIRDARGTRPSVDAQEPDLRIDVYLAKGEAHVSLDLATESLHRRGYRSIGPKAPLKENLAAAVLWRSGWPKAAEEGLPLVDPMCGSGTLLIEAAQMAADIAPNLHREHFGFLAWPQTDLTVWEALRAEAKTRSEAGLARLRSGNSCKFYGSDIVPYAVRYAEEHIERAGLTGLIELRCADALRAVPPEGKAGLVVTNPPYGERLGAAAEMMPLYAQFGQALKRFAGWQVHVLVSDIELGHSLGLRATRKHKLYNGAIACTLLHIPIHALRTVAAPTAALQPATARAAVAATDVISNADHTPAPQPQAAVAAAAMSAAPQLSAGVQMLINRLRKNQKRLKSWLARKDVTCYRLYDADLPEYAVAIDVYGPCVHVQEYAPPVSIDPIKRQQRLREVLVALPHVLPDVAPEHFYLKVRERQRGADQYRPQAQKGVYWQVREGPLAFYVNFTDYLDTGLFLDHRPVRAWLHAQARTKTFLNLFGYTGSATIAAAVGGAKSTTTVDMSNTYLTWAQRNLQLNGLDTRRHTLVQADAMVWLERTDERFDLIFCDPPTFSNSKRMQDSFDIQRDHVVLLNAARNCLNPGGRLIFSTNARKFKLDVEALGAHVDSTTPREITQQTVPQDFANKARPIHRAWLIAGPQPDQPFAH